MTVLITGGAGFIGANVAHALLSTGESVRILDDLSREGVEENIHWLKRHHGSRLALVVADIRDSSAVLSALKGVSHVYHFAAQVSVSTSVVDPRRDFDVNAGGTVNLLEAIRAQPLAPSLIYTSASKVYGQLDAIELQKCGARYEPVDATLDGISEAAPLSFRNPYGCSVGTADQYVLDYVQTYGVRAVVLRLGCVYGPRQQGNEDQGWIAHFLLRALRGQPITILGDGQQVRDVLYVDDLVDALERTRARIGRLSGRVFNVGGGARFTLSVIELVDRIAEILGRPPRLVFGPWRIADQRWYVSDIRAFSAATGWLPSMQPANGVDRLYRWFADQDATAAVAHLSTSSVNEISASIEISR
jgi:CDP-paratose 2-epimerase